MSAILSVKTTKGAQYNVPRASAVNQKSLLLIIGNPMTVIRNRNQSSSMREVLESNDTLISLLMTFDDVKFDRVASLVTEGMVAHGTGQDASIHDFQSSMVDYFSIVAQLIRGNLDDFFTWLTDDLPRVATETPAIEK